ncbi:chemotaxis protein CheW [Pseudomonas sp. ZM23]|uniref:Chemotaxis protein CheW n=1 Tax=Pseudomonas triclosanedens TaxID=2961893 RepID=A0ABY6ZUT5_9PSED|nr:chemotaxis protein CheW [Pseudomonas triclosanedens]MCP8463475.1 chemotaxis protein CheW [Pseudomonas triclosanedens]MCP8469466.1 chemotaxis protein CheW [Pseudomonas triclosanedens]MCP8474276.1 chemotaxis protein CheW [Pseudomonas triclosanedens]WAI48337.1 chemotaxis protein CheW [Pseudomonas triclosanedens]
MASHASRSDSAVAGRLYLQFRLGSDRYALDVHDVVEVLPLPALKRLPEAPAWVAGLYAHRGELLPVLDLSQLAFGHSAPRRTSTRLVLARYRAGGEGPQQNLGLILEQATHTLRRDPAAFRDYELDNGSARYLGPVLEDEQGLLQCVRVDQLLTDEARERLLCGAGSAPA